MPSASENLSCARALSGGRLKGIVVNELKPADNPYLRSYLGKRATVLATLLAKQLSEHPSPERDLRIEAIRFIQQNPHWNGESDGEAEEPKQRLGGWHPDEL